MSQDTRTPLSARIYIHIYGEPAGVPSDPLSARIFIYIYSEPAGVPSDPIRIQYLTIIYGNRAGGVLRDFPTDSIGTVFRGTEVAIYF